MLFNILREVYSKMKNRNNNLQQKDQRQNAYPKRYIVHLIWSPKAITKHKKMKWEQVYI